MIWHWTFGAAGGGLWLFSVLRAYQMLGSWRNIVELMEMGNMADGDDRLFFIKPDEDGCRNLLLGITIGVTLFGILGFMYIAMAIRRMHQ